MKKLIVLSLSLLFTQITLQAMNKTPLHFAAMSNNPKEIRKWISNCPSNINVGNMCGNTPLHFSATFDHIERVRELKT